MATFALCTGLLAFRQSRQHKGRIGHAEIPQEAFQQDIGLLRQAITIVNEGKVAMSQGDYSKAERLFKQSFTVQRSRFLPEAWLALADLYERQGRLTDAANAYHELIYPVKAGSSIGSDPTTQMRYAIVLTQTNHWPEAVQVYEQALGRVKQSGRFPLIDVHFQPNVAEKTKLQALAHLVLGFKRPTYAQLEPNERLTHFTLAVQLEPKMALTQYYYGFGLEGVGHYAEAKAAYQRAASLAPRTSSIQEKSKAAIHYCDTQYVPPKPKSATGR